MRLPVPAVDLLYSPRRPAIPERSPRRCPQSPEEVLRAMDAAGVDKVFVSQCKQWSCERQWLCLDTRLEDVARYTQAAPQRFVGLAGFNPFSVSDSLREIDVAAEHCGFRGVYLHAESFAVPLTDRRLYPLYAKAVERALPVVVQPDAVPILGGEPVISQISTIADDFAELQLVVILNGWPGWSAVDKICERFENLWFGLPADALSSLAGPLGDFLVAGCGRDRCLWGSNGLPWGEALDQVFRLGLPSAVERKLLHDNAWRLFQLAHPAPADLTLPPADPLLAER